MTVLLKNGLLRCGGTRGKAWEWTPVSVSSPPLAAGFCNMTGRMCSAALLLLQYLHCSCEAVRLLKRWSSDEAGLFTLLLKNACLQRGCFSCAVCSLRKMLTVQIKMHTLVKICHDNVRSPFFCSLYMYDYNSCLSAPPDEWGTVRAQRETAIVSFCLFLCCFSSFDDIFLCSASQRLPGE